MNQDKIETLWYKIREVTPYFEIHHRPNGRLAHVVCDNATIADRIIERLNGYNCQLIEKNQYGESVILIGE